MIRPREYIILMILGLLSVHTLGNPFNGYSSRKLEAMGQLLTAQYGISMGNDLSSVSIQGKTLVCKYDNNNRLTQLGIRLFPEQLKQALEPEISDFLERILLELTLEENRGKLKEKLAEYKIDLSLNQVPLGGLIFSKLSYGIKEINDESAFTLTRDTLNYYASWNNKGLSTFAMKIPSNYELILGKDKKELDDELAQNLKLFSCSRNLNEGKIDVSALEKGKEFSTLKGEYLFLKELNSNTYFTSTDTDTTRWLYDKNYPKESFSNFFYHGDPHSNSIQARILHRQYGKETDQFTIPLNELICYFRKDFQTYIGFEKTENPDLTVVVLFYNKNCNYLNMLWIKAKSADIFSDNSIINAELFSYIPSHNIKNLFGEYRQTGKLHPVKL